MQCVLFFPMHNASGPSDILDGNEKDKLVIFSKYNNANEIIVTVAEIHEAISDLGGVSKTLMSS